MSQKLRDISRAAKDPHYDSHQHNHHCAFSGPLKFVFNKKRTSKKVDKSALQNLKKNFLW